MSHRSIPSGFVKSVLHNGVGRYVCPLQRLTIKFCKSHADSRGVRDFIENHLLEFTRNNPGIVVYLQPRRHHPPHFVAEYLNGNSEHMSAANKPKEELCQWVGHLRTRSGDEIIRLRKMWHTDTPSIQGIWTPFTNKDTSLNVTEFPDSKNFRFQVTEESASERLIKMAERLRLSDSQGNSLSSEKNVVEVQAEEKQRLSVQ